MGFFCGVDPLGLVERTRAVNDEIEKEGQKKKSTRSTAEYLDEMEKIMDRAGAKTIPHPPGIRIRIYPTPKTPPKK
jgi:hypothetical protein